MGTAVDLQPIDRLEEKIRQLVGMIDALRAERSKAVDEAAGLRRELDAARARLADATAVSAELATLRDEREAVRSRVAEMLAQIDALNL
jgi:regulator of replication initiation timing